MSAARMCIACGERPVTNTAHDCCAACAAPAIVTSATIGTAALEPVYAAFCAAVGLDLGSADEHVTDARLTLPQRQWLLAFIALWDVAQAIEDAARLPDDDETGEWQA